MVAHKHETLSILSRPIHSFDSYSFKSLSRENVRLTKRESLLKKCQHFKQTSTYRVVLCRNSRVKVKEKELHAGGSSLLHLLTPDGNSRKDHLCRFFFLFFTEQRLHGFVAIYIYIYTYLKINRPNTEYLKAAHLGKHARNRK